MCEFDLQNAQCAHTVRMDVFVQCASYGTHVYIHVYMTDTVINPHKRQGRMIPAPLLLPGWSENISVNKLADTGESDLMVCCTEPPGPEHGH